MNWFKKNRKLIICWVIVLAVSPFFIEILFFANIMGAEATVGFLALLFNEYKHNAELLKYQVRRVLILIGQMVMKHPVCQVNVFCFHTVSSVVILMITGSMTYVILTWYPIVMLGEKLT